MPFCESYLTDVMAHFVSLFLQANLDLFESDIIPLVVSQVPRGAKVAELYAGLGTIGLNVAGVASEVSKLVSIYMDCKTD